MIYEQLRNLQQLNTKKSNNILQRSTKRDSFAVGVGVIHCCRLYLAAVNGLNLLGSSVTLIRGVWTLTGVSS